MKKKLLATGILALCLVFSAFTLLHEIPAEIEVGSKLPKGDVKLKDVSGKEIYLNNAMGKNGLLVVFTCNTCPYVLGWMDRIKESVLHASNFQIGTMLINSNEALRSGKASDDSFEAMVEFHKKNELGAPYVLDENSVLADAFGATRTPQVFLFDKEGTLVYKGAIDDSPKTAADIKEFYLRDAIGALSNGKEVSVKATKSIGCTIKRVHKH
jgi:peroxiredoxin